MHTKSLMRWVERYKNEGNVNIHFTNDFYMV